MFRRLRRRPAGGALLPQTPSEYFCREELWIAFVAVLLFVGPGWAQAPQALQFQTVVEMLSFGPEAVSDARTDIGPTGSSVLFRLSEDAEEAFSAFTERSVGLEVTVTVCGRVVARAVVQDRLSGVGVLPANGIEDADLLAERLRGDTSCED